MYNHVYFELSWRCVTLDLVWEFEAENIKIGIVIIGCVCII